MIDGIMPPRRPSESRANIIPPPRPSPITPSHFKTPEAAAGEDVMRQPFSLSPDAPPKPLKKKKRFSLPKFTKKQLMIIIPVALLVLGGGGVAAYKLLHKKPAPAVVTKTEPPKQEEPPKPTTVASPLTGVQVAPELAELPVTGIMIENSPDARPQSGLRDAGIIYEAIAEGGITRFLALYQESRPDYVGPVRSARPYYVQWVQGYDAAIAHVGGSPEALGLIKSAGVKDLDQFHNSGAYQRISGRYAPHNVYTSLAKLLDLSKAKGFTKSNFTGFARKADAPSTTPTARSIDITMSGFLYNPHYDYDPATNMYMRSQAGKPHTDERSKAQLGSKVLVVLVVPFGIQADGIHSDYKVIGNGKAFIFQDGTLTEGTWEKRSGKEGLRLGDANGAPLAINAGQTWITVIKTAGSVAYKP